MTKPVDSRRSKDSGKLDIDRRRYAERRDDGSRLWLSRVYESIYIANYVNAIFPKFPVTVHAFSNIEAELSLAEWTAANLGVSDAKAGACLKTIRAFATHLINLGLVVDDKGATILPNDSSKADAFEDLCLKTGTHG